VGSDAVAQYCRDVEHYLTKVNGGHLVRIVGTGFDLVRGWAEAGVPLSVVFRAIDLKAERHREGHAARPLRIEFCDSDVRAIFDQWRRAVGVPRADEPAAEEASSKRPSLTKQIDRALERLSRLAGRLDLPPPLQEAVSDTLQALAEIREVAKGARGEAREAIAARVAPIDAALIHAARAAAPPAVVTALSSQAAAELAAFRDRLDDHAWQQAIDVTIDRLLRDHYGLPAF
jgi:hypothetical protein